MHPKRSCTAIYASVSLVLAEPKRPSVAECNRAIDDADLKNLVEAYNIACGVSATLRLIILLQKVVPVT
mgnify:FL=1